MLILRCPKCRNTMKCQPVQGKIEGKKKRCVYCGFTMGVRKSMIGQQP